MTRTEVAIVAASLSRALSISSLHRTHLPCVRAFLPLGLNFSSTCYPSGGSCERAVPRGKPARVTRAPRRSCLPVAHDIATEFGAAVREFRRFSTVIFNGHARRNFSGVIGPFVFTVDSSPSYISSIAHHYRRWRTNDAMDFAKFH